MPGTVLTLNFSLHVLKWVEFERAAHLVSDGKVEVVLSCTTAGETFIPDGTLRTDAKFLRSPSHSWPWPVWVAYREYRYVDTVSRLDEVKATRRAIMSRDRSVCGYCGGKADTYDHIFPKSRGGEDTWYNLVSACKACNNRKGNRTPEEAGMKLLWNPKNPEKDAHNALQDRVYQVLGAGALSQ